MGSKTGSSKAFEAWSFLKQRLHILESRAFAHPREIWWCSIGINIGAEIDGKHDNFERPVIVMRAYNKEMLLVLPLTTKPKEDPFHFKIQTNQKTSWVKLTQVRVISNKRLLRKIDILDSAQFASLKEAWRKYI